MSSVAAAPPPAAVASAVARTAAEAAFLGAASPPWRWERGEEGGRDVGLGGRDVWGLSRRAVRRRVRPLPPVLLSPPPFSPYLVLPDVVLGQLLFGGVGVADLVKVLGRVLGWVEKGGRGKG